jgi:hypothetical protein
MYKIINISEYYEISIQKYYVTLILFMKINQHIDAYKNVSKMYNNYFYRPYTWKAGQSLEMYWCIF